MNYTAEIKTMCDLLISYFPWFKSYIQFILLVIVIATVALIIIAVNSTITNTRISDLADENRSIKKLLFKIYFAHRIEMKCNHGIDLDKAADEYSRKKMEILYQQLDDYCEKLINSSPSNTETEIFEEE